MQVQYSASNMERQYQEFQVALLSFKHKMAYPWKFIVKKLRARACLAEFLGTFILCVRITPTISHNALLHYTDDCVVIIDDR